jgi:hypothetical protein
MCVFAVCHTGVTDGVLFPLLFFFFLLLPLSPHSCSRNAKQQYDDKQRNELKQAATA